MAISTLTLNEDQIDMLPEALLLSFIGDLERLADDTGSDASFTARFRDNAGQEWELPCYIVQVGTRAVMWSQTDSAGTADEMVADAEADLYDQVKAFAEDIAAGLTA